MNEKKIDGWLLRSELPQGGEKNAVYAIYKHEWKAAHGNRGKSAAGEVFGCIPHEKGFFAMRFVGKDWD